MDYSNQEDLVDQTFDKAKSLILPSENNNYKSKILQSNVLLYCVTAILVIKIFTILISIDLPSNIFFADITKSTLESFVNQTRESVGLKPLVTNDKLTQAAQLKAQNMVQNNYFDHVSPTGIKPWFWFSQAGYKFNYAGENLAVGFYDSLEVYNAWLNSPSHKANIINPHYTDVGTAVVSGFEGNAIIVVQEFGSQLPAKIIAKKTSTKPVAVSVKQKPIAKVAPVQPAKPSTVATKTTPAESTTKNNDEQVLSQSVSSQESIVAPTNTITNNLHSKIMNSVLYNYNTWLQDIIYGISSIVIGILLVLIFSNFNIHFKKQLVVRAVLIMVLLSAATLLNKEVIISLIPHQIVI